MSTAMIPLSQDPAFRRRGLGASEIATAIGLDGWSTPLQLWLVKTGRAEPSEQTDAMLWGQIMEAPIVEWYAETTRGFARWREDVDGETPIVCSDEPWMWATPDRVAVLTDGRELVVEAKNVGSYNSSAWGAPGTDDVPMQYLVQWTIQAHVLGLTEGAIVASIGGRPPQTWTLVKNDRLAKVVIERARAFWHDNVCADVEPDPKDGADLRKALQVLLPFDTGPMLAATERDRALAEELRRLEEIRVRAQELEQHAENRIKRRIGDNAGIEGDFGRVTWKADRNGRRVFRRAWRSSDGEE